MMVRMRKHFDRCLRRGGNWEEQGLRNSLVESWDWRLYWVRGVVCEGVRLEMEGLDGRVWRGDFDESRGEWGE